MPPGWLAAVALAGVTAAAAQSSDVARVLAEGEQRLAVGDAAGAEAAFDRAAAAVHRHDVEISLVRAYMQAGDYRRALAFAAHAAGAHGDAPAATGLYAWLLTSGGQRQIAERLLRPLLAEQSGDALLAHAAARLAEPWPTADVALLRPPERFAPYAFGAEAAGRTAATAVLLADGRRALAPAAALPPRTRKLWLRNGLGGTVAAELEQRVEVAGAQLAVLALRAPLPVPSELTTAVRAPFAGSVGYAVEFASQGTAEAAWPLLTLGFIGRSALVGELPVLGIDMPPGARGGPVFDDAGRLVGVTVRAPDGTDRLAPLAALPEDLRPSFGLPSPGAPTPRWPLDLIYERALLVALQVVLADEP